jgi:hypothetical protein
MNINQYISRTLLNLPGFHTNRKIVVIESDDWGSIRMPSREIYDFLIRQGHKVDNLSFNRYDSLACETDLSLLFNVLHSVKDKNNNPAIITANTVVTNPDFVKIKASNYQQYYYEPFTETLKHYSGHQGSFKLWQEGMNAGVFRPQFHGREHLNVTRWMKALKTNTGNVRFGFDLEMFDLSIGNQITEDSFMDTLNFESDSELAFQRDSIVEGLQMFENIFGYKSTTFIAPCYIWDCRLNKTLADFGVKALQGGWFQLEPTVGYEHKFKKRFHYIGQKNKYDQTYLVRNISFEPSINTVTDLKNDVLKRMDFLFKMKKPVIISSHRLNYIGYIDSNNREKNLKLFRELLQQIVKYWPDVEFISSDKLADIIV